MFESLETPCDRHTWQTVPVESASGGIQIGFSLREYDFEELDIRAHQQYGRVEHERLTFCPLGPITVKLRAAFWQSRALADGAWAAYDECSEAVGWLSRKGFIMPGK